MVKTKKRRFFRLDDDVRVARRWYLGDPRTAGTGAGAGDEINPAEFRRCHRLTIDAPLSISIREAGCPLDLTMSDFAVPIVSGRLQSAFSDSADVQLLPAVVDGQCDFFVLNILHEVDAIDETRSGILKWKPKDGRPGKLGSFRDVDPLVLAGHRIPPNLQIFRPRGWRVVIVVSEAMRERFIEFGAIGARFTELACSFDLN